MRKKIIIIISFFLTILIFVIIGSNKLQQNLGSKTSDNLKLKVSKEKVLNSWSKEDEEGNKYKKYSYVDIESSLINGEIISKRTNNSYTIDKGKTKDGKQKLETVFFTDNVFIKNKLDGKWFNIEYATTTDEVFNEETKVSWLDRIIEPAFAMDSFSPDATPETSSVDGYVERVFVGDLFSNIRNGNGTGFNDSTASSTYNASFTTYITTNTFTTIRRSVFVFDTSSLPDNVTITSSSLSVMIGATYNNAGGSHGVGLTQAASASNTALASSDYQSITSYTTRFATDVPISSMIIDNYKSWLLNSSGISNISLTGVSKFSLRVDSDIDNSTPTWESGLRTGLGSYWADGGSTKKPLLLIDYTAPGNNIIQESTLFFE